MYLSDAGIIVMNITIGYVLYRIIIGPIELLLNMFFSIAFTLSESVWAAILLLSLAVNLFTLPLYAMADSKQREEQEREKRMAPWISHIKEHFYGDERIMLQQAYMRECGKGAFSSLNGMMPILFEIPFFVAAYRFLSSLSLLEGAEFAGISNLGMPDGLISVWGITINILPFLMTGINIISSLVYTKDSGKKEKIQMIVIALFFLVLLYESPSGVVLYWTANNLFSLAKNIVYLWRAEGKKQNSDEKIKRRNDNSKEHNRLSGLFFCMMLCFTVLSGFMIPSLLVSASPLEFFDIESAFCPTRYLVSTALIAAGFFMLWGQALYHLAGGAMKKILIGISAFFLLAGIPTYVFFAKRPGNISGDLVYDSFFISDEDFTGGAVICIVLLALFYIGWKLMQSYTLKKLYQLLQGLLRGLAISVTLTAAAIGIQNTVKINNTWNEYIASSENGNAASDILFEDIVLSTTEENVMVIMLDRAIGAYVPYMMQEKPELMEVYAGFTYYPNTISHGLHTIYGAPGLFGGYEYIPESMNDKDAELIKDKYNEALLLMPVLFSENGYEVYLYDLPLAGFRAVSDMSFYDEYPEIHAGYISKKDVSSDYSEKAMSYNNTEDAFFVWSFSKLLPIVFQEPLYNDGKYLLASRCFPYSGREGADYLKENGELPNLYGTGRSTAEKYATQLQNVSCMLSASDEAPAAYVSFDNDLPHHMTAVKEPEYTVVDYADNSEYDESHTDRFILPDGSGLESVNTDWYKVNVATLVALGNVFERMKELGVYDNTRIVVVSDHGYNYDDSKYMIFHYDDKGRFDTEFAYPLLMVKESGADRFTVDESFMTNADVPFLAMNGLIKDMTNPFTGKEISTEAKNDPQYVYDCGVSNPVEYEKSYVYNKGKWFSVRDDRRNMDNWEYLGEW